MTPDIFDIYTGKNITKMRVALEKAKRALTEISLAANREIETIHDGDYEISDVLEVLHNIEKDADKTNEEIAKALE